ncbi:MAG: SurA N-terminal domain-containing protein [Rhizomicrobium sp.]|nr:SurA N-terminal domain-containing protein [Rhizomicrobium sp.]
MLQEMRKYAKSKLANVLLGLLAVSFVSWGVGDFVRASNDSSVAKVGGVAIDQQDFRRDYTNSVRSEANRRGEATLSPEEIRKLKIADAVLEQKIASQALDNVVKKLGLTASDAMVTGIIHRYSAFSGVTGQFDRPTFQRTIERIGYSEQGFIELVRADTARNQLVQAVEGGFKVPPGYAKLLFNYFTEIRAADYVVVDAKSLGAIPAPSDAELTAYVKAHPGQFSTPEYRDVTYAAITPDDLMPTIKVTDALIQQAYDDHKDEFVIPEKRDLDQISFQTEAAAKVAYEKAQKGGLDQLTNEKGEKATPQLAITTADLDPARAKAVFALAKDGITPPMKTPAGSFAILRVKSITPGVTRTLDTVKEELRGKIARELATSKLSDMSNAYTDASSGGLALADAAKKVGMKSGRIAAIDLAGLAPDGQKAAAPDDQEFRNIAFHTEPGDEGDPQLAKSGALYVVSVNSITAPKLKPLEQVRPQALAAWTEQQRIALLKKKVQDLAAQANREDSLDGAAKAIGAAVQKSPALDHRTSDDTFSPALVQQIFTAKPGQTVLGPKAKSGDYVLARITGIVHPPMPDKGPSNIAITRELSSGIGATITESYVAQQKTDQVVSYNRANIDKAAGSE